MRKARMIARRGEQTMMTPIPISTTLIDLILDLAAANTDDMIQDCCDALCEYITIEGHQLTRAETILAMHTARRRDNDENYHAEHVRDALRNNTCWEI